MEFAVPRANMFNPEVGGGTVQPITGAIILQGASGDDDSHEEEPVVLVQPSADYPMEDLLFGERVESVRSLMQKPCQVKYIAEDSKSWCFTPLGPLQTVANHMDSTMNVAFTWAGFYRVLYTGIACSERFKIFPRDSSWWGAEPIFRQSFGTELKPAVGPLAPMTFAGPNLGAEFVIPYYSQRKYLLAWQGGNTLDIAGYYESFNVERLNRINASDRDGGLNLASPAAYYSFGPDIRATCFRQVPSFRLDFSINPKYDEFWFRSL